MKRDPDALRAETFDLLILGGGITGAGVALDAALNGWRVALIDQGDFASGTSSVSSKLVHGGIRYLEQRAFRLVYEALHERRVLLRIAPHLVHPLRFFIPFYRGARVPRWKWRIGLTLYDFLAGRSNIQRSHLLDCTRLRQQLPLLKPAGLRGGAVYFDAQMDDARLCLEVIQTATWHGACAVNYVQALAFEMLGGQIQGVRARDHLRGDEFSIRARVVLNATGPWVDSVCRLAGDTTGPHLDPTKGTHLIAPNPGLDAALLLLHPRDGRVFFIIPWPAGCATDQVVQHHASSTVLIGTTDNRVSEPAGRLTVTPEEVTYLLEGYNHYLTPPLSQEDILGSFTGLRPLIRARPGEPSSLTREFRIFTSPSGLVSVAGGKYTTYRHMAEEITRTVAGRLRRPYRSLTESCPLDGTPDGDWSSFLPQETAALVRLHDLPAASACHLAQRYGRRARDVASFLDRDRKLALPVVDGEPDLRVEFLYQRQYEMAVQPADFLLRRTRLGLYHPRLLQCPPPETSAFP